MKNITKILIGIGILFLIIGVVSAAQLKDTADVKVKGNDLMIDGKKVANVTEYGDTNYITDVILNDNPIIKAVGGNGANEVPSVSDYNLVYEFLTDNGMYYSFGKDGKYYVVTIDEGNWKGTMLKEMDTWCIENSK